MITGYRLLFGLALRRERILAPVTVVIFVLVNLATAASIASAYGTPEKRRMLEAGPGATTAFRFLLGDTVHIQSIASATVWRAGLFMIAALGVCTVLMVVRQTRREEELGRTELIRSGVVGPLAPTAAAASVASLFGIAVAAAMSLMLFGFGADAASVGIVFAQYAGTALAAVGVGLLTAQVAATGHIGNLVGASVVLIGYLLRGIPDATGDVGWLRWISPVGWAQVMDPFGANNAWPLLADLAVLACCGAAAGWVAGHRDLGGGLIAPRPGPAGTDRLPNVEAMVAQTSTPLLRSWLGGLGVYALVIGFMGPSVDQLAQGNQLVTDVLSARLGGIGLSTVFAVTMTSILAVAAGAWAVTLAERMRTEEASGRAEAVLATPTARGRYFLAYALVAGGGLVAAMVVTAVCIVVGNGIAGGGWATPAAHQAQIAAVQLPAMFVIGALVVALYAVAPVLVHLGWPVVVVALLLGPLSGMFNLPQWVDDLSPFTHVPLVPVEPMRWLPVVVMLCVAGGLVLVGWISFRHRDIG